jgi:hypothetical protein
MLENLNTAKRLENNPFGTPSMQIDGSQGEAITPGLKDGQDYSEWLLDAGLDPHNIELISPPRISRWQVYDGSWRTAYKLTFRVIDKATELNLPLLYNQAKKTKAPKPPVKTNTDKALVILWSDLQIGKVGSRGGVPELIERVNGVRERLVALAKQEKPTRIVFCDVGDLIEGFSNTADMAQLQGNQLSIMGQIDLATTMIWDTLKALAAHCNEIAYLTVGSNHCQWRVNKQKVGTGLDDWGVHVGRTLARLSHEVGLPVKFYEPAEWDESLVHDVFDDNFHRLGLFHGHQASRPNGIVSWIQSQQLGNQPTASATLYVHGHFHHLSVLEMGNNDRGSSRFIVQAKTLDSGSDWYRTSGGAGDSTPGVVVIPLEKQTEFRGTVLVI